MKLIHIVAGNVMGGAQRYALDICRHFASEGDEVIAVTRDTLAIDTQFRLAGITLVHAPLRDYPDLFSSLALKPLLQSASKNQPVIVHVHRYRDALTAILARRLAQRPDVRIVISRHICQPAKDNWLRRFIYRQIDANIFGSEFSRRTFLSTWPQSRFPFDPARLQVAYDSRNTTSTLLPEPERGAVTAMYHGYLREGKGLMTLLSALALLKDTRLRLKIVGSGDAEYIDALRNRAITLGIMDKIDWHYNTEDPAALIEHCHFGILPSESPEAGGMANIDYMAAGRVQISTFNSAQSEYMTPGVEALQVPPHDPEALAAAMRRLYSDKDLRLCMDRNAYITYTKSLSWEIFISRIKKIYTQYAPVTSSK